MENKTDITQANENILKTDDTNTSSIETDSSATETTSTETTSTESVEVADASVVQKEKFSDDTDNISDATNSDIITDSNKNSEANITTKTDTTPDISNGSSDNQTSISANEIESPKSSFDEETVEQLVENRISQKNTLNNKKKKKKKKKKHYALKTLVVILSFILVFAISFLIARSLFTLDNKRTANATQKAADISQKASENNSDENVIPVELPDSTGEPATPIDVSDDNSANSSSSSSSSSSSNSSSSSKKNNTPTEKNNEDDGEIILPGTPSPDEEESGGTAGIVLE